MNQSTLNNMEKTLLDEIAIAAMIEYMRHNHESELMFADAPQSIARLSYAQAQAMLNERERRNAKRTKPEPEPVKSEPDWHNPDGLPSPGKGWRFCVKGEKEDPPRTEWWSSGRQLWANVCQMRGIPIDPNHTYRTNKPLPTTPPQP